MKKIIKKILITFTFFLPIISFAQTSPSPSPSPLPTINIDIPNPAGPNKDLMSILRLFLNNIIMPIAAVLVVMYIIYAGFTFVQANGNPKAIEDAKKRLLWGLIGAGILLGAAAISSAVCNTLNGILSTKIICG